MKDEPYWKIRDPVKRAEAKERFEKLHPHPVPGVPKRGTQKVERIVSDERPAFVGPSGVIHYFDLTNDATKRLAFALARSNAPQLDPRLKPEFVDGQLILRGSKGNVNPACDHTPAMLAIIIAHMTKVEDTKQQTTDNENNK